MKSLKCPSRSGQLSENAGAGSIIRFGFYTTKSGGKRVSSRTFYPGYVFVNMDLNERTWHLVKDTPKVSGFVGGRHPSPVPETEINAIFQQVAEGAAKPKPRVVAPCHTFRRTGA